MYSDCPTFFAKDESSPTYRELTLDRFLSLFLFSFSLAGVGLAEFDGNISIKSSRSPIPAKLTKSMGSNQGEDSGTSDRLIHNHIRSPAHCIKSKTSENVRPVILIENEQHSTQAY